MNIFKEMKDLSSTGGKMKFVCCPHKLDFCTDCQIKEEKEKGCKVEFQLNFFCDRSHLWAHGLAVASTHRTEQKKPYQKATHHLYLPIHCPPTTTGTHEPTSLLVYHSSRTIQHHTRSITKLPPETSQVSKLNQDAPQETQGTQ